MRFILGLFAASLMLVTVGSNAAVTITIQPSGGNVVATTSGSLTLPSCISTVSGPSFGIIYWAASNDYTYTVGQGTATQCSINFATAQPLNSVSTDQPANSYTGGPIGVSSLAGGTILTVPQGYVSGTPINSTSTWSGKTLADLNLVAGTYTFNFGTDTITYIVGTPATTHSVPTLSEWGMIILSSLLALGAMFTLRRRRY